MLLIVFLAFLIPVALMVLNSNISKKNVLIREKNSPFECGFDPNNSSRAPFSMQFFIVAVIFLIFDVEISLIIPIPLLNNLMNLNAWMFLTWFFLLILILGLFHEWNQGALQWKN